MSDDEAVAEATAAPVIREFIDDPRTSQADICRTLRDQTWANRWLGGGAATWRHLLPFVKECQSDPIRLLDLPCGAGDITRHAAVAARRLGKRVQLVGGDLNERVLACARQWTNNPVPLTLVRADARYVPFQAGSFDAVIVATFLHHLKVEEVVQVLRQAGEVSRGVVVVADLTHSARGAWLVSHFGSCLGFSAISRHDATVSLRQAYTPEQLAAAARQAGLPGWRLYEHGFYRMTLVYRGWGQNGNDVKGGAGTIQR